MTQPSISQLFKRRPADLDPLLPSAKLSALSPTPCPDPSAAHPAVSPVSSPDIKGDSLVESSRSSAAAPPSPERQQTSLAPVFQLRAPTAAPSPSDWKIVGSSVLLKRYMCSVAPPSPPEPAAASIKLAAFDMDGTIIKTKSGNTFPTSERDWVFFNDHVAPTLRRLHEQGYTLVIFSNQAGFPKQNVFSGRGKQVMTKVDAFMQQLALPITAYLATQRDGNRKPQAGMLRLFLASAGCDSLHTDSFFCGDAAGRPHDHSADDKGFAEAAGLKFMLPEQVFVAE